MVGKRIKWYNKKENWLSKNRQVILLVEIKNMYLVEEIYNHLPDTIKERYEQCSDSMPDNIKDLKQLIDDIITEVNDALESLDDRKNDDQENEKEGIKDSSDKIIKNLIVYNNKIIQKQKKRWLEYVKKELEDSQGKNRCNKDYKYIMREVEYTKLLKEMRSDNLKLQDIDELIQRRLQQIEDWASDKNSLMVDFPYLKNLTPKQILNAFVYDLKHIIYNTLLDNYAGNPKAYIVSHPNILLEMGALFGVSSRVPITVNQRINSDNENEFYYQYKSGDKTIVSIVTQNKDGQTVKPIFLHNLDQDDMVLLLATLAFRKANFIKNKMIRVYFKDMAKYLNKTVCGKTYNFIKERYEKLFNRKFEIQYIKGGRKVEYKIRFFQYMKFDIDDKYYDRSYVDVQVSDFIAEQLIDMQTTNMYRNQLMSFTNPVAKLIMFPLQRHRLDCYIHNQDYRKTYSYDYFASNILFPPKNSKKQNIKMLIEAFEEFKKQNIIIHSVEYNDKKETFDVRFIPLSNIEIQDFIYNNDKIEKIEA